MIDLSIVVPVYNEKETIEEVITRVRELPLTTELIIVDDGSTDGTRDILNKYRDDLDLRIVFHSHNQGKGAALRTGFANVSGRYTTIQDADLEYNPQDLLKLYKLSQSRREAAAIYGTRFWQKGKPENMLDDAEHVRGVYLTGIYLVPEPSTLLIWALGLLCLAGVNRRRRRA